MIPQKESNDVRSGEQVAEHTKSSTGRIRVSHRAPGDHRTTDSRINVWCVTDSSDTRIMGPGYKDNTSTVKLSLHLLETAKLS